MADWRIVVVVTAVAIVLVLHTGLCITGIGDMVAFTNINIKVFNVRLSAQRAVVCQSARQSSTVGSAHLAVGQSSDIRHTPHCSKEELV